MRRFSLAVYTAALVGCGGHADDGSLVGLDWEQGQTWHVASSVRDATAADGAWSNDVVWSYQVVEQGYVPDDDDILYPFALRSDGRLNSLSVVRVSAEATLNDDPAVLGTDPVVYLVFEEQRDRLVGLVEYAIENGERVQRAVSTTDLSLSTSGLSASGLTRVPTYLAPFGVRYESAERRTELGSAVTSLPNDDGTLDVVFEDSFGGGDVALRYADGLPWPVHTVTTTSDVRLLTDDDVETLRVRSPMRSDAPEMYDYRAGLASSVDLTRALVLDTETVEAGGWTAGVPDEYQPWSGPRWKFKEGALVFGYVPTRHTYSTLVVANVAMFKYQLNQYQDHPAAYEEASQGLEATVFEFYDSFRADLDGGLILVADGWIRHSQAGWSYPLEDLSPLDKYALQRYLQDPYSVDNPFHAQAWEILNHYNPVGDGVSANTAGRAAAAILAQAPTGPVSVTIDDVEITYTVADQQGLLTATHTATSNHTYGTPLVEYGDFTRDPTAAGFHRIITHYHRDQRVPVVIDTYSERTEEHVPAYATALKVTETTGTTDDDRVNLNTATVTELTALDGIGDVRALAILDYRYTYGPFQTVDELSLVSGIGAKTVDALAWELTVEPRLREFSVEASVSLVGAISHPSQVGVEAPQTGEIDYAYTLLTDENGRILGGEWDEYHDTPDVVWVPYDNPAYPLIGENPYVEYGTSRE
jgi:competence ComEA-like helix-hairpin-helix protein